MPAPVSPLTLSDSDKQQLQQWVSAFGTPQQVVLRCRIVLAAADGQSDNASAEQLAVNRHTVRLWRNRFRQQGLKSLWEIAPGRGRKSTYGGEKIQQIVDTTLQSRPRGRSQWSCRSLARHLGVSKSTVNNVWRSHNLKPHRVKSFKLSRDPLFLEKLTDVVGLYLNRPEQAMVLCVDEKSRIQALDRTQPGLPMKKGRCGTMTHDYQRNGSTTLFAALELAQGKVVGECYQRHLHQEFLRFLRRLDTEFPGRVPLHLVMDNYGTHKEPQVQAWLKKHPRFVLHFVPTRSSWLNLVERWFGELTRNCVRRGSFCSVGDLQHAIQEFLDSWNENPRPFVWTATVESILAKLSRCRQTLQKIQPGCTLPRSRKKKHSVV
ncbi:MAG TPA: IS630 family transposase [Acidobacteriaceae bacterium]|nr:IS630 family transposase [Acidobacteriaceae bacterium]